ncbi:hypothetical protein CFOL_v3_06206 [Cephalotus follicularis]|uniref:Tify domain-containing protein n=1 Tax=Cephalotus follicularis TaxID=3775 RepID=A0A1Q3B4F5_CEPFO|nr:hypothetical protein CFOL_v3_06206 [Cephalotus follicularis]
MAKSAECLNDDETAAYNNSSSIKPKRSHLWFMDEPEAELFPNKKQAVEVANNNLFSEILNPNISPWGSASSFYSVPTHITDHLFDPEAIRSLNFDDRNIQSVSTEKVNTVRKHNGNLYGNDSLFGLSMSHTMEDSQLGLNYGGIRKVKVSQVKDSENTLSVSMGNAYDRVDNDVMSAAHAYNKVNCSSLSTGIIYSKPDDNIMSMGDTYDRENNIFISMGQSYNNREDNIPMGKTYHQNNNTIAKCHQFSKVENCIFPVNQTCNKADNIAILIGHVYGKGDDSAISVGNTYSEGDKNSLSFGQSYIKGESTIITFGGYYDDINSSGSLISSFDTLMAQPSVQGSEALNEKELVKSNADALVSTNRTYSSATGSVSRKKKDTKTSKKIPPNNFPSNVRSLLSTGMLDGVPVKYIVWSREKEHRGVIKGSGYQCCCRSCNFSKVINAYEFELHAGCKTKHPNNHIYFENGKTIYGIVQELRSTPPSMLFDVIQTITGSPINQKSFRIWKESYLAATLELHRIYGKDDERSQLS